MSETPKFTPGPWEVERSETHGIFWIDAPGEGVCNLYIKVDETTFSPFRNAEANAHLMSAAPELYEALEMVRDGDDDAKADGLPHMNPSARARVDAALAKAEGGK